MRTTIDYGIDLGTTNSSISLLQGTEPEVIRNNANQEVTPSVIHIDKNDNLVVGSRAYDFLDRDSNNTWGEFKLKMGQKEVYTFERSKREMSPEELSAEILKVLKGSVKQKKGEDIQAAVISVPAAFTLPQNEATNQAAKLAGLVQCPLVQEPVAAAMAYGFQDESDKVFWLVYDFGGGTFDAAIIQVRDGVIQVVNYWGDNNLGGKLIDWKIVNELLVPKLQEEYGLEKFVRGNEKWQVVFAKLKQAAEKAKVELSWAESTTVYIDTLVLEKDASPVVFEYEISRKQLEPLLEPFVQRTIKICKKVLKDKRLEPENIEKCILVGGPTLTPYIRARLKDGEKGLGIPLEFEIDPMTVVSRGAAIFAGTQKLVIEELPDLEVGQFSVNLEYKTTGSDQEFAVGGRVYGTETADLSGYTLVFDNISVKESWSSGKVPINKDGVFITELWAEKDIRNQFEIKLSNAEGVQQNLAYQLVQYTVGQVITNPPLTHSIGLATANNEVLRFFEKGDSLPGNKRQFVKTTRSVKAGEAEYAIRIPVIEGEKNVADRNDLIGTLEIKGDELIRDVPMGTEIEITIDIDETRLVTSKAYIPIADQEFEGVLKLESELPDEKQMKDKAAREKKRLQELKQQARDIDDQDAQHKLVEIEDQNLEEDIDLTLEAASGDSTALDEAQHRLRDLQDAVDELENILEWPALLGDAEETVRSTRELLLEIDGKPEEIKKLDDLEKEIQQAIDANDTDLLRRKIMQVRNHGMAVLIEDPRFWVGYLGQLREQKNSMRDQSLAEEIFNRADRAVQDGDVDGLRAAVRQLMHLLPQEVQDQVEQDVGYGSTIVR